MNPAQIQTQGPGFVYFIQAGNSGPIKIGWAYFPDERIRELQIGNHETLHLLATVEGDIKLEHTIHRKLAAHRTRGEWFTDCLDLRATIDEYRARPTNHTRRRFVANGNGQHCRNCQALLTEADDMKMPAHEWAGHCRACREFAAARDAGIRPVHIGGHMDAAHTQPRTLNLPERIELVRTLKRHGLGHVRLPGLTVDGPQCHGLEHGCICQDCTATPGEATEPAPQPWQARASRHAA